MKLERKHLFSFLWAPVLVLSGCPTTEDPPPDPTEVECPGPLPAAMVACADPSCSSTTVMKRFGEATLASDKGKKWVVATWATSEIAAENENTTVDYTKEAATGLTAELARRDPATLAALREISHARAEAMFGAEQYASIYSDERRARIQSEAAIRAMQQKGPFDLTNVSGTGTAIVGRSEEFIPKGARRQGMMCSATAATCGATALCVIPEQQTMGTCESAMMIKFRTNLVDFTRVPSTVKKVGTFGAIVVDDAMNVAQGDIDTLLQRFEEHIAPIDHQFFGQPRDMMGRDRDGNGVVILWLTPKVAMRGLPGLVGYFQSDDLLPSTMAATSNAADILYMLPPGGSITLDALSGTIGHEYQHLINYYQKKIIRNSGPEDVWLDEGIASFAEDMLGYGADAFENVAAYMGVFSEVSLTGAGVVSGETDSSERRGMGHLFVRYVFEQGGGAEWGAGPAAITDKGGIAAVKKLVQTADTGTLIFTKTGTGRSFHEWIGDLVTTTAVDGAAYPEVSCNPKYFFKKPETDAYTNYQRGIDLRSSFTNARGMMISLTGPMTATLGTDDTSIPVPTNGGEIRTVDVATGSVKISVSGSVDYEVGLRPLPIQK